MGVSTVDLSHVRALALALSENKQLETANAGGYYTYNSTKHISGIDIIHPTWTKRLHIFPDLNLRDSYVEDSVRKRPLIKKMARSQKSELSSRLLSYNIFYKLQMFL